MAYSVTDNKQRPLLDEGCDVGTNSRTNRRLMISAGRAGHVMCHPAKDDHPAKAGMAGSDGMDRHHNHPAEGRTGGMDGMAMD